MYQPLMRPRRRPGLSLGPHFVACCRRAEKAGKKRQRLSLRQRQPIVGRIEGPLLVSIGGHVFEAKHAEILEPDPEPEPDPFTGFSLSFPARYTYVSPEFEQLLKENTCP